MPENVGFASGAGGRPHLDCHLPRAETTTLSTTNLRRCKRKQNSSRARLLFKYRIACFLILSYCICILDSSITIALGKPKRVIRDEHDMFVRAARKLLL